MMTHSLVRRASRPGNSQLAVSVWGASSAGFLTAPSGTSPTSVSSWSSEQEAAGSRPLWALAPSLLRSISLSAQKGNKNGRSASNTDHRRQKPRNQSAQICFPPPGTRKMTAARGNMDENIGRRGWWSHRHSSALFSEWAAESPDLGGRGETRSEGRRGGERRAERLRGDQRRRSWSEVKIHRGGGQGSDGGVDPASRFLAGRSVWAARWRGAGKGPKLEPRTRTPRGGSSPARRVSVFREQKAARRRSPLAAAGRVSSPRKGGGGGGWWSRRHCTATACTSRSSWRRSRAGSRWGWRLTTPTRLRSWESSSASPPTPISSTSSRTTSTTPTSDPKESPPPPPRRRPGRVPGGGGIRADPCCAIFSTVSTPSVTYLYRINSSGFDPSEISWPEQLD